ncbi:putative conserved membrane protein [Synechococcus sp. PROS-9-1]|uniref:DNA polymerase III subunit beta n=1 Tax=Synechococcus sp. PROS-9-1 TaxID=1968775 RepID=UPI0018601D12|nr:DNA polymerase III subunit beta [Synechococcus sp. PROS-9-1]QNJ33038.1 putative conserved membrane protein [Synechococcus sp. PROS-9-1]
MPSRLSTSTAYWNLRAEQVMDQVFQAAEPSLKAVEIRVEPAPDPANNQVADPLATSQRSTQQWQQLTLIGMTLGALLCSAWLARSWQLSEQALYRERNMALTEKLKARATPSPSASPKPAEPETVASLPSLEPLTLPLSAAIAPAPLSQPALVGVVHAEVGGSAIFQIDNQSLSATPGESIGNSGWSLLSLSSTGAVIERNGKRQSLSIGGAF